ncbi:MAG: hypothetical protein AB7E13_08900 [Arcobacteraceae bacterium]
MKILTKEQILNLFIFIFAIALSIIPLYDFIGTGPFNWHIKQADSVEGAIELGFLFILTYSVFKFFNRIRSIGFLLISLMLILYFRRHNIDVQFVFVFMYISMLYFLGSIVLNSMSIKYKNSLIFLVGLAVWVLYSCILSLFYLAHIEVLLFSSILLFIISFKFKQHNLIILIINKINLFKQNYSIENPFLKTSLFIVFLILFVQSSHKLSYDELWYSSRGLEVLNKNGSFFEPILMLQHWVNYYPKFYEIVIFPLEFFNSYTASRMFAIFVLIFLLRAIYEFLSPEISQAQTLLIILSIATMPAVANSSIVSKADFISAYILVLAVLYFVKYTEIKTLSLFLLSVILLVFSLATKLSVVPYIGILSIVFFIYFLINIKQLKRNDLTKEYYIIYALFIIVFIFITFRTISIVGVPFVSLNQLSGTIKTLYDICGFYYKELFGDVIVQREASNFTIYQLFLKYHFFPTESRLIFAWISNLYLIVFSLFFFFFFKDKMKLNIYKIIIFLILAVFIFVIFIVMGELPSPGGDGNYYLFPIIIIVTLISLDKRIASLYKFLFPIIITNIIILYVTNHGWSYGTNKFHLNFLENPFDKKEKQLKILKAIMAEDIYYHLQNTTNNKVIGFGPEKYLYALGNSYESGLHIRGQRPYLFKNFKAFIDMIQRTKTSHLLYPKYIPNDKFVEYAERLKECTQVQRFSGKSFILLDVSNGIDKCKSVEVPEKDFKYKELEINVSSLVLLNKNNSNQKLITTFKKNEKYYPKNTVGLLSGAHISLMIQDHEFLNNNVVLQAKIMQNIYSKRNSDGSLIIKIKNINGEVVNEKTIDLISNDLKFINFELNRMSSNKYLLEFSYRGIKDKSEVILIEPKLIFSKEQNDAIDRNNTI